MDDQKSKIDHAKWLLERTLGWIATADVKVGVAMALDTAMLGGLAAAYTGSSPQARTAWCYLALCAAVAAMVVAIFCAGMAAIPRMLGPVHSMIFFARVAERSEADYVAQFSKLDSANFLADLAAQIHRNSQIATSKHWWVRKSLIWLFLGSIPWLISVALLVRG